MKNLTKITMENVKKENETMSKRDALMEKIENYLKENDDVLMDVMEEMDGWNGYLGDDRYYEMDCLDDIYGPFTATEILQKAFFGWDEDDWHTDDRGKKHNGPFNPNREYFRFNGYGNLVSSNYKDYSDHLDRYFIEKLYKERYNVNIDNYELSNLFDELESIEDEQ